MFAELVGVTPLTVYRWELPEQAAQARRPRATAAARLAAIAARRPHGPSDDTQIPASALEPTEQGELLPLLERASSGDFQRVEAELLALMASGHLRTLAGRAMAAQALARILLLSRADVCGAFSALAPLLPDLPRLPEFVELHAQVTAALIFSWPDGRFFDAGKANAHLARAERLMARFGDPEPRFLACMVRVTLGLVLTDTDAIRAVLAEATELERVLESPAYGTLLLEGEAQAAAAAGRSDAAARTFEQIAERGSVALSRVRALAQLAAMSMHEGRPPSDALGLLERARAIAAQARLQLGTHTFVLDTIEGGALARLARFADAERVLGGALDVAAELRWTPVFAALSLAQVHLGTGRGEALRALGSRLGAIDVASFATTTRALGALLTTAADLLDAPADRRERLEVLDRQVEAIAREVGWLDLRGDVLLAAALLTSRLGSPEQARRSLRRAERHFARFPSIWVTAVMRRIDGVTLARSGQLDEARRQIESALGTLSLAGDVGGATSARLALARIGAAIGEPGARAAADRLRAELERLGFADGADELRELPAHEALPAAALQPGGAAGSLVVPLRRLAVRGMSAVLIQRELVTIASELAHGAARLEEVDSSGHSSLLVHAGPQGEPPSSWVELGDGAGRRLRLGVGPNIGAEVRSSLVAIATVAELALELATLRGLAGLPSSTSPAAHAEPVEIRGFVSVSAAMRRLKTDLARLSRSRSTVVISGESGTGKEVVARAIHDLSTRASKPYVAFNCAAVPRELFEGQLFGYRRGAFTGAAVDHPGVLRAADGGTVLLDEIGELPLDVQPKLLRFLDSGEVLPLGERKPLRLDVRVLAATWRDLEQLVRERRFREDLFYRLQVVTLRVPPLRERPDDIIALARHFVGLSTPEGREPPVLAPDALAALKAHAWPGNVRELRNVIERALAFEPLPRIVGAGELRMGGSR